MKRILILCICLLFSVTTFIQAEEETKMFNSPVNPETYLIRPGDKLLVTFINSKIKSITLEIDPEVKIVHATIGLINLRSKTLSYAKTELAKKLKSLYNVQNIEISITSPREVSIAIYGAVRRPGVYRGMTSDRVSDIIKKAGGISENGTTRNIKFYADDSYLNVDLDNANYLGDMNSNPHLYAGTKLEVPSKSSQTVHLTGDVNNSREIELKDGDNLATLIQLAGKFKNSATLSDVQIIRGNKKIESSEIVAGDIIIVKSSLRNDNNLLKIFGAVTNQGIYTYSQPISLDELLALAGGYSESANKELTTVFRQPLVNNHGEQSEIRYPISIPLQDTEHSSIQLEANDSIFVPWEVGFVKVSGAVLNPGYFPYVKGADVLYYIKSSGRFLPTANQDEIQIFNSISEKTIFVSTGVLVPDGAEIIVQVKEELK